MSESETPPANTRLLALQFSFSNRAIVPECLPVRSAETTEEHIVRQDRKERGETEVLMEPTPNVSLSRVLEDLDGAQYDLVDAFYQSRIGKNGRFQMLRFLFARRAFATPSDHCIFLRDEYLSALQRIVDEAFWRVRAFRNPYFANGVVVEGQQTLSINMEARVSRFLPDGQPVVVWERDEERKKVGEHPHPLRPEHELRIGPDGPVLAEVEKPHFSKKGEPK